MLNRKGVYWEQSQALHPHISSWHSDVNQKTLTCLLFYHHYISVVAPAMILFKYNMLRLFWDDVMRVVLFIGMRAQLESVCT